MRVVGMSILFLVLSQIIAAWCAACFGYHFGTEQYGNIAGLCATLGLSAGVALAIWQSLQVSKP